uniref:Uncharacterized protein n=1 Tax=Ciona savignyi TaxID=51511 RepID=H2ZGH1_CIOSA
MEKKMESVVKNEISDSYPKEIHSMGVNKAIPSTDIKSEPNVEAEHATKSTKAKISGVIHKIEETTKMRKTPSSASPFTPKSTSSIGRQSSQRSSSSMNNTPSPSPSKHTKTKQESSRQHQHVKRSNSNSSTKHGHSSKSHRPPNPKNKKVEHKSVHPSHHKYKEEPNPVTSLTVGTNICPSE